MSKSLRGSIILTLAALIWGSAFVAQSVAMDHVGPFTYQTVRSFLASGFIFLLAYANSLIQKKKGTYVKPTKQSVKRLLIGGTVCGLALGVAANLQQFGIKYTTVGKAGFVTALYILFVPILSLLLFKKKPSLKVWCGIGIAVVGLYLLCMNESLTVSKGDIFVFFCSVCFAVHIICCDKFAGNCDCFYLSCVQFFVNGIVSCILMLIFEPNGIAVFSQNFSAVWFTVAYAAIMSSGLAYTFQLLGQRDVNPTLASLLMSLESVFAVLSGMVVLGQIPTFKEGLGCVLMFAAIILAQLPDKKKSVE